MSCEKNRGAFLTHAAGAPQVAQPFGNQAGAAAGLETIFEAARSQAATGDVVQQRLAEGKTRSLFNEMRAAGFTPPTHSASGLPRADAQFGYAALYDTLNALRNGKPLPALASQVVAAAGQTRQLSGQVFAEAAQRWRCGSCGRFIKPGGAHLCPTTATPQTFQRALMRR
ncbi:MAG TPA: hypothetical protein VFS21_23525, partial [Roseiflexaceae bacterium]|nr:hypothetical protein [Roseiflexaceae bacterium]